MAKMETMLMKEGILIVVWVLGIVVKRVYEVS